MPNAARTAIKEIKKPLVGADIFIEFNKETSANLIIILF
jgi:hypothetical protein